MLPIEGMTQTSRSINTKPSRHRWTITSSCIWALTFGFMSSTRRWWTSPSLHSCMVLQCLYCSRWRHLQYTCKSSSRRYMLPTFINYHQEWARILHKRRLVSQSMLHFSFFSTELGSWTIGKCSKIIGTTRWHQYSLCAQVTISSLLWPQEHLWYSLPWLRSQCTYFWKCCRIKGWWS